MIKIITDHQDEENKSVARLKKYIALCGVRRNYKKLLDGCRSIKAKVDVLKKELEKLGVEGERLCVLVCLFGCYNKPPFIHIHIFCVQRY